MALTFPALPDRRRRGTGSLGCLLACAALAFALPVPGPAAGRLGVIYWEDGQNLTLNLRDDTWSLENVVISHGRDRQTRITAGLARGAEKAGGLTEIDLSGSVHIEFRGTVLDADSALVMVRGEELVSVQVKGTQARFSHQRSDSARRIDGRADAIGYDAASNQVSFSGNTSWTDGHHRLEDGQQVTYNIDTGVVTGSRTRGVIDLEDSRERVPPPRMPERSQAQ